MHPNDNRTKLLKDFREHGDRQAFKNLVLSFDRMIYKSAHRVARTAFGVHDHFDDLVQEGYEAVIKGILTVKNYDYLTSYCSLLIKSHQWKLVKKTYIVDVKLDSVSRTAGKKFLFKMSTLLDLMQEKDPDHKEEKRSKFSNQIRVPVEDIIEAETRMAMVNGFMPFEDKICHNHSKMSKVDQELLSREMHKAISSLDQKYQVILKDRFYSDNPKTLRQLGKELGCDKLTVNARRKNALKQLHKVFRSNQIIQELIA